MKIYQIKNKISGKKYIGQTTTSIEKRFHQHCRPSSTYCRLLHNAIKKYGIDNFSVKELASTDSIEKLNELEIKFIEELKTLSPYGYNLLSGGKNQRHSQETKDKMSKTRTGKKVPALQKPRGKRPLSVGLAISKAKKSKPNGLLGKKRKGIKQPKLRKKVGYIDGGKTYSFNSLKEAAFYFNKSHTNLVAHLKGRKPTWCGYKWFYIN